jgi:hypothetical protein
MAERGELAGEFDGAGRREPTARVEIAAPEQIGRCDDGGSHRAVFIGPLRPRQFFVVPKIEAHGPMLHLDGGQVPHGGHQLIGVKRLLKDAAPEKAGRQFRVRRCRDIEERHAICKAKKIFWRICDDEIYLFSIGREHSSCRRGIRSYDSKAIPNQKVA